MAKRKRMAKRMWVSRDNLDDSDYELWSAKPDHNNSGCYTTSGTCDCIRLGIFCSDKFEKYTGYKLDPGECKQVRIILEET